MKSILDRTNLSHIVVTTISAIKIKACVIILVNISLIAIVIRYYRGINFNIDVEHLILALCGGSLGMDAVLRFMPQIFILVFPFLLIRKKISGLLLFLIRVNIVWLWIDIISILVKPFVPFFADESWSYIRGCAGGNFLVFNFSILWFICRRNFGPFLEIGIGLFSPPITLYAIAFGINNTYFSWAHFYD